MSRCSAAAASEADEQETRETERKKRLDVCKFEGVILSMYLCDGAAALADERAQVERVAPQKTVLRQIVSIEEFEEESERRKRRQQRLALLFLLLFRVRTRRVAVGLASRQNGGEEGSQVT